MPYITLYSNNYNPSGFNKGKLDLKCEFGEQLCSVMGKLNEYRMPENQLLVLYTKFGKKIDNWNFPIKENMIFYINEN